MIKEQIEYKKKVEPRCRIWLAISLFLLIMVYIFLHFTKISNTNVRVACDIFFDASLLSTVTLFFNYLVLCVNNEEYCFAERSRTYRVSILAVVICVCLIVAGVTRSRTWIAVLLIVLFLLIMFVRNATYLNTQQVLLITNDVRETHIKYQEMFENISERVENLNKEEVSLMKARIEVAQSGNDIDKAKKDKRNVVISEKLNPNNYQMPPEPKSREYTGLLGLFKGRIVVVMYAINANRYKNAFEKAYKGSEERNKKIERMKDEAFYKLKYIEGTQDEQLKMGVPIDSGERARLSYTFYRRKKFEKKIKKY